MTSHTERLSLTQLFGAVLRLLLLDVIKTSYTERLSLTTYLLINKTLA